MSKPDPTINLEHHMSYGISLTLARPFDEVVPDVRAALAAQGSGVALETLRVSG